MAAAVLCFVIAIDLLAQAAHAAKVGIENIGPDSPLVSESVNIIRKLQLILDEEIPAIVLWPLNTTRSQKVFRGPTEHVYLHISYSSSPTQASISDKQLRKDKE